MILSTFSTLDRFKIKLFVNKFTVDTLLTIHQSLMIVECRTCKPWVTTGYTFLNKFETTINFQ